MRLLWVFIIFAAGCSVYKSSDRDDFNSHGFERRPVATALSAEDRSLLASPCSAFDGAGERDLAPIFGSPVRLTMSNQISQKTSTCLISNRSPGARLAAISLLACSWKPVDGTPVPSAADEFAVQTTEDDLRDQGLSVVTQNVDHGDHLRMNCEAYVPTPDLVDDRRSGEHGTLALLPKFAVLTEALKVTTLTSDSAQ